MQNSIWMYIIPVLVYLELFTHLLVLQVCGELIAIREHFTALALLFFLLAECQACGLVPGPLCPGQTCWAWRGHGRPLWARDVSDVPVAVWIAQVRALTAGAVGKAPRVMTLRISFHTNRMKEKESVRSTTAKNNVVDKLILKQVCNFGTETVLCRQTY